VVIGSRIIEQLERTPPQEACAAVTAFIAEIRAALDA
jgi:tryptophan synthase alpha chain